MHVKRGEGQVSIEFGAGPTTSGEEVYTDIVLDKDGFGTVIGLEVINLRYQTGPNVIDPGHEILEGEGSTRASYDEQADALAVHLAPGERSLDQCVVKGVITLDGDGRLAKLEAAKG